MARRSNPARLVLALSVAAVLAVFLVYVSLAGGGTPSIQPSELEGRSEVVVLGGRVVGKPQTGAAVNTFRLRDPKGTSTVTVRYADTLPDQFKVGRDLQVRGRLVNGIFIGEPGTMITKCPSKYVPKKQQT